MTKIINYRTLETIIEDENLTIRELIRYTFSDGESLLIRCEKVNRKNKIIKDSHFMGYEWMVDSILKNGCIKS